jgi:hypothetical protein
VLRNRPSRRHEVCTARGPCNMAEAELHRPHHAWARIDGGRSHAVANRNDHCLPEIMGPDRVAEEKLVG